MTHNVSRFGKGVQPSALVSAMVSLWYREGFTVVNTNCVRSSAFYLQKALAKIHKINKDPSEEHANLYTSSHSYPTPQSLKTPKTILIPCLCQIPGVSQKTARAIHAKYETIQELINALANDSTCLDEITLNCGDKKRKISKTARYNISNYLGL